MIIRATFNDNDFTQILEAYFYKFKFCNYNLYYKNCKDLKEYVDKSVKSADLVRKITFETDKMTKEELKQFTNEAYNAPKSSCAAEVSVTAFLQ